MLSRVTTSTVCVSDVWAWPMHEMLSLSFLTASTVGILHLKSCARDSRFLIGCSSALLWRPPRSAKPRPGLQMRSSRLWRVSSFHFLSLHCLGLNAQIPVFSRLSCTQPRGTGSRFRWSRWRMFYILRPPTLRTLEPRHLTFSRLLWPILNSWTFFSSSSLALVRARQ